MSSSKKCNFVPSVAKLNEEEFWVFVNNLKRLTLYCKFPQSKTKEMVGTRIHNFVSSFCCVKIKSF